MNVVEAMMVQRTEVLLKELEVLAEEVIREGQNKATSLAISDLTTQNELSPSLVKRLGIVHVQLHTLKSLCNG